MKEIVGLLGRWKFWKKETQGKRDCFYRCALNDILTIRKEEHRGFCRCPPMSKPSIAREDSRVSSPGTRLPKEVTRSPRWGSLPVVTSAPRPMAWHLIVAVANPVASFRADRQPITDPRPAPGFVPRFKLLPCWAGSPGLFDARVLLTAASWLLEFLSTSLQR